MEKYKKIDKILIFTSILYLVIPIIIQLFFWYNRLISIPLIILLVIATFLVIKKFVLIDKNTFNTLFKDKKKLMIIFGLIVIINIMSGAGGLFYQNWDYHGRNAIFRDLINNSWPVKYDYSNLAYEKSIFGSSGIFNYYFAYWLPGAIIGKIVGFKVGSFFMLIWQTLGVLCFFYLTLRYLKQIKIRYFWIFITFGGLNIIGYIILNLISGGTIIPDPITHIDTSMGVFCMSSFITQLFWVFNQSIPAWIATLLFLQEKDLKKCGYFFALLVPFGPFPMLGLLYLIFSMIIFGENYNKMINIERIKKMLTIENFFGVISVLPVVYMYTLNVSQKGIWFVEAYHSGTFINTITNYILFVILEFLVYIIIVNRKNYKQVLVCFAFFTIAPIFRVGGADLGNRSTIPLLIVMFLLICEYLNNIELKNKAVFIKQCLLTLLLLVAGITNFNEFYRSVNYTVINYKNNYSNFSDAYQTFSSFENKECAGFITNFVIPNDINNKLLQFILR